MPHIRSRRSPTERGAALLFVVVVIAVLSLVGLALISRSTSENDAIGAKHGYDRAVSCAEAAREYLLSQFRTYGASPSSITRTETSGDETFGTGHYDNVGLASIEPAGGFEHNSLGVTDISNRISTAGLGGQVYRMVVTCSTGTGTKRHQSEVEYLVRFGL